MIPRHSPRSLSASPSSGSSRTPGSRPRTPCVHVCMFVCLCVCCVCVCLYALRGCTGNGQGRVRPWGPFTRKGVEQQASPLLDSCLIFWKAEVVGWKVEQKEGRARRTNLQLAREARTCGFAATNRAASASGSSAAAVQSTTAREGRRRKGSVSCLAEKPGADKWVECKDVPSTAGAARPQDWMQGHSQHS